MENAMLAPAYGLGGNGCRTKLHKSRVSMVKNRGKDKACIVITLVGSNTGQYGPTPMNNECMVEFLTCFS